MYAGLSTENRARVPTADGSCGLGSYIQHLIDAGVDTDEAILRSSTANEETLNAAHANRSMHGQIDSLVKRRDCELMKLFVEEDGPAKIAALCTMHGQIDSLVTHDDCKLGRAALLELPDQKDGPARILALTHIGGRRRPGRQ